MKKQKQWFEDWFNTPYYHILYQNRNFEEAELFIDNLIKAINIPKTSKILDLACGRGRHALYLSQKGFNVIGVDIAPDNIEFAKQYESDFLSFEIHDMRIPWKTRFNVILNLFTSFGYFETDEENFKVINSVSNSLTPEGVFVLDYLNILNSVDKICPYEEKTIGNITFQIKKSFEENCIVKTISFYDKGQNHMYEEKLRCYTKETLTDIFEREGLSIKNIYGSYTLETFDELQSERLILVAKKNN